MPPITTFDINTLFQQAFGIGRGKPYDASQIKEETISEAGVFDQPTVNDAEGTEFVNMRDSVKSLTPYGQQIFMPMKLGGVLLPNEPSIYITGTKRIEKTSLTGSVRKGSVKELLAIDDYQVTIRGIALNYESTKAYPEDLVKSIHDLYLRNEALKVESALTNLLGIYYLVVEAVDFPEMIGVQHAQAYQLRCISDEDFVLEID